MQDKLHYTIKDVQIINEASVYQGFFEIKKFKLKHRLFSGGWSKELHRELFCRGHAVAILLYDPAQDKVVLIEQFRIGALDNKNGPWLLEIPAGIVEPEEKAEAVAIREAKEEAGCEIKKLIPICDTYSSPGGSSETVQLFQA